MSEIILSGSNLVEHIAKRDACSTNMVLSSPIPPICQQEDCILGIDEAGRGPVLGPMVYGVSFCPLSKKDEFASLGCDDSKVLSEKKREELFSLLCNLSEYVGWTVDVISPNYISNSMLKRSKRSLNEVAEDSTVSLIQRLLNLGVKVAEIFVDTVGPPEKYRNKLLHFFPECKITVAKKADSLYPIVSAASICAKVTRDRVLSNWRFPEKLEGDHTFGSGYPNDPTTKGFLSFYLDAVFGFPNLVRFSWSTSEKVLVKDAIGIEWETDEDDNVRRASKFFSSVRDNPTNSMVHQYFKENNIMNAALF